LYLDYNVFFVVEFAEGTVRSLEELDRS